MVEAFIIIFVLGAASGLWLSRLIGATKDMIR